MDCSFGLPATYMVFSGIMLLPNYIQLLRNRHRVYEMKTTLIQLHYAKSKSKVLMKVIVSLV